MFQLIYASVAVQFIAVTEGGVEVEVFVVVERIPIVTIALLTSDVLVSTRNIENGVTLLFPAPELGADIARVFIKHIDVFKHQYARGAA
jgi:hypothetical protein